MFANSYWYLLNHRLGLIQAFMQGGYQLQLWGSVTGRADVVARRTLQAFGYSCYTIPLAAGSRIGPREVFALPRIRKLLRQCRPSAVYTFTTKAHICFAVAARKQHIPHYLTVTGLGKSFCEASRPHAVRSSAGRYLLVCAVRRATRVFFQTKHDLTRLQGHCPTLSQKAILVPGSGIDLRRFQPNTVENLSDDIRFGIIARLLDSKGFDVFLDALIAARQTFGRRVLGTVAAARISDDPRAQRLHRRLVNASVDGLIAYLPELTDVRKALAQVDVLALPTTYPEGIPRSLLEGLASGKAILTTPIGARGGVVINGVNGFVVGLSPTEWGKAFHRAACLTRKRLRKMGYASRKIAERTFNSDVVNQAYVDALETAS